MRVQRVGTKDNVYSDRHSWSQNVQNFDRSDARFEGGSFKVEVLGNAARGTVYRKFAIARPNAA